MSDVSNDNLKQQNVKELNPPHPGIDPKESSTKYLNDYKQLLSLLFVLGKEVKEFSSNMDYVTNDAINIVGLSALMESVASDGLNGNHNLRRDEYGSNSRQKDANVDILLEADEGLRDADEYVMLL